jgi:hypothetical protein
MMTDLCGATAMAKAARSAIIIDARTKRMIAIVRAGARRCFKCAVVM